MALSHSLPATATRSAVRVRVEGTSVPGIERAFAESFTIGRGMQATVHVDSGRVSRLHAEVVLEEGVWVLRDAGSTNGTYHNDERVERVVLETETAVRLGREGPCVRLAVVPAVGTSKVDGPMVRGPLGSRPPLFPETELQAWRADARAAASEEPTEGGTPVMGSKAANRVSVPKQETPQSSAYSVYVALGVLLLLAVALGFVLL